MKKREIKGVELGGLRENNIDQNIFYENIVSIKN